MAKRIPGIEKSRTDVGYKLFGQLRTAGKDGSAALHEVCERVAVRVEICRPTIVGEMPYGQVFTRLDGGDEVDEGIFALSL